MNNAPDIEAWAEDTLARAGYAVLSPKMGALFDSIEARLLIGAAVPSSDFQAVLYAIYADPYGDYHRCKSVCMEDVPINGMGGAGQILQDFGSETDRDQTN